MGGAPGNLPLTATAFEAAQRENRLGTLLNLDQVPNALGFMFGFAQMILYIIYKDVKKEQKLPEQAVGIKLGTLLNLDQVNPYDKQLGPTEMPIELTESHV